MKQKFWSPERRHPSSRKRKFQIVKIFFFNSHRPSHLGHGVQCMYYEHSERDSICMPCILYIAHTHSFSFGFLSVFKWEIGKTLFTFSVVLLWRFFRLKHVQPANVRKEPQPTPPPPKFDDIWQKKFRLVLLSFKNSHSTASNTWN